MVSGKTTTLKRGMVFACLFMLLSLQLPASARLVQDSSKEQDAVRLVELATALDTIRARIANDPTNSRLRAKYETVTAEYDATSARLGGDRAPGDALEVGPNAPVGEGSFPAPPNCTPVNTSASNTTPTPINDNVNNDSVIAVAGAGPYLVDVNITTNITHTFNGDLDMTLISPAGTTAVISTDNGSSFDNVFNGTTWDDDAMTPITDTTFANNVVVPLAIPEGALAKFIGENPNGNWTLRIFDDAGGDTGSFTWSINIVSSSGAPMETTVMGSNTTPTPINDNVNNDSIIPIATAGTYVVDVNITTNITHTFNGDIDMTLISPAGTTAIISTDNGSSFDNVFNGTTWDDDAMTPITDTTFANNVVVPLAVPEGALGAFTGENPNGNWTLRIFDDAGGDTGSFTWSITVVTAECMVVGGDCMITCPANVTAPATDPTGAVVNYPAPTTSGECGAITCTPASGSFFPVGTTTVTCTEAVGMTTTTTTYSSGNLAVPIPSSGMMTPQTINVADPGTVTDVDVRIRLNHTWDEDLDISLTGPNGATIDLSSDNGGSADNYGSGANDCSGTPTVLDDEAGTPIAGSAAPFAGSFSPEQALTAFDGIPAAGNWTLNINDDTAGDSGTLGCFELVITRSVSTAGTSCSFTVTVAIPFDSVCVDDATCDTFSAVVNVDPSSPLYGFWQYTVASTGEVFSGTANTVNYVPNRSLTMGDNVTPNVSMYAQIDYARRTCIVRVSDRTTGRQFVLRDRNITQPNPNCGAMN
jgi:subtilisin-like proprotein convertase family protein